MADLCCLDEALVSTMSGARGPHPRENDIGFLVNETLRKQAKL